MPNRATWIIHILPVLLIASWNVLAFELAQCGSPLGMQSGDIPDKDISASSFHDSSSVGPQHGRLKHEGNGGAWCPKPMISNESSEYLEIRLKGLFAVTRTRTQGRYGNGVGKEYAEEFLIDYWRPGFHQWRRWKDHKNKQLLTGNTNTYLVVEQLADPAIVATNIRFIPYSSHTRTVCMRVELVGCPWNEGLLSYSMVQGDHGALDLRDKTYEGLQDGGRLTGGLGQLVDGHIGQTDYKLNLYGWGDGYEWVGWRNDSASLAGGRPVEIVFEFQQVRNFSAMFLFVNNMYTQDIQVFSEARVYLGVDGSTFSGPAIIFTNKPDLLVQRARRVSIKLHHRVGKFMKLQLYFASRFILLSEISFESVVVPGNFTEEELMENTIDKIYPVGVKEQPETPGISVNVAVPVSKVSVPSAESEPNYLAGLLIGSLVTIIVVLVSAIIFMALSRRRKANAQQRFPTEKNELPLRVPLNSNNGHLYGQVAVDEPEKSFFVSEHCPNNINMYFNNTQHIPRDNPKYAEIPDIVSQDYAVPYLTETQAALFKTSVPPTPVRTLPPLHNFNPKPPPVPPPPEKYYATSQICQSRGGMAVTPPPPPGPPPPAPGPPLASGSQRGSSSSSSTYSQVLSKHEPQQIPRTDLRIVDKLGSGTFGEAHVFEFINRPNLDLCNYVAVKMLKKGASDKSKEEFNKEVSSHIKLRHEHICSLVGVCTSEEPWFLVYEYSDLGDLNQFLQEHIADTAPSIPNNANTLSYGCLIDMASQVASGMQYLESQKFVHGDLAARSCLVSAHFRIKVSHLKVIPNMYSIDYPEINSIRLPIRWMAWESILHGRLTTKSDVWSFAVTLWEILTFAREQPFEDQPDEKILDNANQFQLNTDDIMLLPKPINCSKEIFEIMCECWQRNEKERPRFTEIYLFLQRMNLEYKVVKKKF